MLSIFFVKGYIMADLKYTVVTNTTLTDDYEMRNNEIYFVPRSKDKDGNIVYLQSIHSFSKIIRSNGLDCSFENGEHVTYLNQHSVDLFLPTIAFFIDFYLDNKDVIDLIILSIKAYITSVSTKSDESAKVRLDVELIDGEKKRKTCVRYDGPADCVDELKNLIKEIKK